MIETGHIQPSCPFPSFPIAYVEKGVVCVISCINIQALVFLHPFVIKEKWILITQV